MVHSERPPLLKLPLTTLYSLENDYSVLKMKAKYESDGEETHHGSPSQVSKPYQLEQVTRKPNHLDKSDEFESFLELELNCHRLLYPLRDWRTRWIGSRVES